MKPGSQRKYGQDDLGKFGLGLKTASLSQCTRLTVASRITPARRKIEARQIDVEWIIEHDRWEAFVLSPDDRDDAMVQPLDEHVGTVVLWQNLDRALGYKVPWGERARTGLLVLADRLETHLGMVFHRFLAGEVHRRRKLKITLNGNEIEPWDPFARSERVTQELTPLEFDVATDNGRGSVSLARYILPAKSQFSDPSMWATAGASGYWNSLQGFYVYRANRLVQIGGWNRTRSQDEHSKLARVAIDFQPDLDAAFGIDWAKARVELPSELMQQIKQPVDDLVRQAKIAYNSAGGDADRTPTRRSLTAGNHSTPAPTKATVVPGLKRGRPSKTRVAIELAADHTRQRPALNRIVNELLKADPEVAHDLGW